MNITISPIQMNRSVAATYCGVSIDKFDKDYRPHLTERRDGGYTYFLRTELDRLVQEKFIQEADWASEKREQKQPKKTTRIKSPAKNDPFSDVVAAYSAK